ncbi:hypothetical protein BX616_006965, partial [Lobosporangium transversale]
MSVGPHKYRSIQPSPSLGNDRSLTIGQRVDILKNWDRHVINYNIGLKGGSMFEPPKSVFCDCHNITPTILNHILAKREELLNVPAGQSSARYRLQSNTRSFYPVEDALSHTIEHIRRDLLLPIDNLGVRLLGGAIYALLEARVGNLTFKNLNSRTV